MQSGSKKKAHQVVGLRAGSQIWLLKHQRGLDKQKWGGKYQGMLLGVLTGFRPENCLVRGFVVQ